MTETPLWKPLLTVLAAVVGPPVGLFTAFIALITWTGCFLTCEGEQPRPLTGLLLGALALGLALSGPVLAWVLMRSGAWVAGTVLAPVLVAALMLAHAN